MTSEKKIYKECFKEIATELVVFWGKCIIKEATKEIVKKGIKILKTVKNWFCRKIGKQTEQENQTIKKQEELAPSETLNDAIDRDTNTQEISLIPNMLYKGDTCLICGAPNTGKSILAMQIGLDIAEGKKSKIVPNNSNQKIKPQQVFYYDGEMRNSDIRKRFGESMGKYPNAFVRIQGGELDNLGKLYNDVHQRITKEHPHEDCTVIFDDIACFNRNKSTKDVNGFFLSINTLKAKYERQGCNLTVIIVMHTTKNYKKHKPLELNELSGSAEFGRFANSAIALTESRFGNSKRILKILKYKFGSIPSEVSVCNIVSHPYLHLEYECSMPEEAALPTNKTAKPKITNESTKANFEHIEMKDYQLVENNTQFNSAKRDKRRKVTPAVLSRIKQLYNEGKTQQEIADLLQLCRKTVNKYLKALKQEAIMCNLLPTN